MFRNVSYVQNSWLCTNQNNTNTAEYFPLLIHISKWNHFNVVCILTLLSLNTLAKNITLKNGARIRILLESSFLNVQILNNGITDLIQVSS